MSKTDMSHRPSSRFNTPAHHSRLRVLVMLVVGVAVALAVGTMKSWAYARPP